jgi:DUF2075 family protein
MELYSGTSLQFIDDANLNRISNHLKVAFFDYYRYNPSPGEMQSWDNSLRAMSGLVSYSKLDDHGILLEYQLPMTSRRLDFFITGRNPVGQDHAVIVELKQWTSTKPSEGINEVSTHLGGKSTDVLHPSVQVGKYRQYLEDSHTAFHQAPSPIKLDSCAYLHNYARDPKDAIFDSKFDRTIQENPLFLKEDAKKMADYLRARLSLGQGMEVMKRIHDGKQRPSKKLMEHFSSVIKGNPVYVLLDTQLIAFDKVLAAVQHALKTGEKTILLIPGGPGTGKSVIALNLIAELSKLGRNAHYATGSKAFTSTLREIIGRSATVQFKYFNNYTNTPTDDIDVIICDEAHRLRSSSSGRFHPISNPRPQIDEIVNAAKVSVFLLDDRQSVRPGEVGSLQLVRDATTRNLTRLSEFDPLEIQFRCSGSDGFIQWVNNTLSIERTPNAIWNTAKEPFDFRIFDSPQAVDDAIRLKAAEGYTARMTAGFCWPWSEPLESGQLVDDVQLGDYRRPWNAKPKEMCKGGYHISKDIPISSLWAYDKRGIDQVGCIYTAQGFEFDYAGVIFGEDLIYRFDSEGWVGIPTNSEDSVVRRSKTAFLELVKNTYRVLLTRGMKGCYVYFADKETERFVKSRMEGSRVL